MSKVRQAQVQILRRSLEQDDLIPHDEVFATRVSGVVLHRIQGQVWSVGLKRIRSR